MRITRRTRITRHRRPAAVAERAAPAPAVAGPGTPARVVRWLATTILATAATLLIIHETDYRGGEAWVAGHAIALLTAMPAHVYRTIFFVDVGAPDVFGLRVTGECTSAIIVAGLLALTALLALVTRVPLRRLASAALLSGGVFYLLNLVRLVVIALATKRWGLGSGFYWSHIWAGGFITIIGVAGILALYLATLGRIRRTGPAPDGPA